MKYKLCFIEKFRCSLSSLLFLQLLAEAYIAVPLMPSLSWANFYFSLELCTPLFGVQERKPSWRVCHRRGRLPETWSRPKVCFIHVTCNQRFYDRLSYFSGVKVSHDIRIQYPHAWLKTNPAVFHSPSLYPLLG